MKTWTSTIVYSVFDMGKECETKEEYVQLTKDLFWEEHGIQLRDDEITDIDFEEVSDVS